MKKWLLMLAPLLVVTIISVMLTDADVYDGEWCSFEVPNGWLLVSEGDDAIVINGYSNTGCFELLVIGRYEDVPISEDSVVDYLEYYTSGFVSSMQDGGSFGRCTYKETQVYYPPKADFMTAADTYSFLNPNAAMADYAFGYDTTGQGVGDIVMISLCEFGFTSRTWNDTEFVDQLRTVYHTFTYHRSHQSTLSQDETTYSGKGYSAPIEIKFEDSNIIKDPQTSMDLDGVHYECINCRWLPSVPVRYGMSQSCCG